MNTFIFTYLQEIPHTARATRPGHFPCEMILTNAESLKANFTVKHLHKSNANNSIINVHPSQVIPCCCHRTEKNKDNFSQFKQRPRVSDTKNLPQNFEWYFAFIIFPWVVGYYFILFYSPEFQIHIFFPFLLQKFSIIKFKLLHQEGSNNQTFWNIIGEQFFRSWQGNINIHDETDLVRKV